MNRHRVTVALTAAVLTASAFLPVARAKVVAWTEPGPVIPALDGLESKDLPIVMKYPNRPVAEVLDALAGAAGLHLYIEGAPGCCPVTVDVGEITLRQALEILAAKAGLRYEVPQPDMLHVKLPTRDELGEQGVEPPQLVTRVEPAYPEDALAARATGRVLLQAVILADGAVGDVRIVKGIEGWRSLDYSALAAVRRWKYRPAMKDGQPLSVYFTVDLEFRLQDAK